MEDFYNLFRSKRHPFYTNNHDCVIYGEGGKGKLFERVMIPLVTEVFGKQDCNKQDHRFYVVTDADGGNHSTLCETYSHAIQHTIQSKQIHRFSYKFSPKHSCYNFFSPQDERTNCHVKTSHIPTSLEQELVSKGVDRKIQCKREKIKADLSNGKSNHEALDNFSAIIGLSVPEVIRASVEEDWFIDEQWYKEIERDLSIFLIGRDSAQ